MTTMFEKAVNAAIDTGQVEGRLSANAIVGAVLEAIREPDEAMIDAAGDDIAAEEIWEAMVGNIIEGAK